MLSPCAVAAVALLCYPLSRAELIKYITVGQQSNRTILGLRVNRIYAWLPGKGGKIDKKLHAGPPPRVGGRENLVILWLHNRE